MVEVRSECLLSEIRSEPLIKQVHAICSEDQMTPTKTDIADLA
jgi:hypothetical protein